MKRVDVGEFLASFRSAPLIDVRSPSEFARGHIVGAINLPLFDDDERAEVGKLYKQTGRQSAMIRGLEIAGRKMSCLATGGLEIAARHPSRAHTLIDGEKESVAAVVGIHCWRGGMRSGSVGWLLEQVDLCPVLLNGGYQAYRRAGHTLFEQPWNLVVLGGLTGAGKTFQLNRLAAAGEQVIDLEGLANHRGSAFGGVGLGAQPTVEQFENLLHDRLRELDPQRRIWIEAESQSIGKTFVPLPFFRQAIEAPIITMDVPVDRRVEILTSEYSRFSKDDLIESVNRIHKRLGGQNVQAAVTAIQNGEYARCVRICLAYYDKCYGKGTRFLSQRPSETTLNVADPEDPGITIQLISAADSLDKKPDPAIVCP